MLLRRSLACVLALSAPSVFAQSVPIQHEVSIGFSDIRDADDQFIGASYRYYFDEVNINKQPWAISPYLQRINSVSFDYFGIDDLDIFNVKGEWFYSDNLVLRGRYSSGNTAFAYYDDTIQRFGGDISTFANRHWEYGLGFDYYEQAVEAMGTIDSHNAFISEQLNDTEFSINVFARFTSFNTRGNSFTPGWDITFKGTNFENEFSLEFDADYYFKPNWSVGIMAIHENNDYYGSDNLVEFGTDYWFNPHASIKFGLGYDTDEQTLGSVTLLGTFRF